MLRVKVKNFKRIYLKLKGLDRCPQKSGTCTKVFFTTPKKPNSALRKLAKLRLSNFKKAIAHIPGETHNLLKFSSVLIRGCRVRDTPGIKYRVIRNAKGYNCKAIV
jgi:small subunit ribosomal protein S12